MKTTINILLFIFIQFSLSAQIVFEANVSKNVVIVGERFEVKFKVNENAGQFSPPALTHFNILSGPNQSTSMQWINGNMSSSKTFSYMLSANNEGKYVIGVAKIKINNTIYETQPIEITVEKQTNTSSNQPTASTKNLSKDQNEDLFIKLFVTKKKTYLGEQILATYKVYSRVDLIGISDSKEPNFNGFWKEDIKLSDNTQLEREMLDGKPYNTAVLKKTLLFPQKSGKIIIEPLEVTFRVRVSEQGNPKNIFDQFFGRYTEKNIPIKSNNFELEVEALPQGKPKEFAGAVGQFKMNASIDKSEVKTNDAINFKIEYSGKGNLKLIDLPKIEFPADFEVYDPKITNKIVVTENGMSGSKTAEYLIIPRHSGDFTIPEIQFSYFDPATNKYEKIQNGPFTIKVLKGENEELFSDNQSVNKKSLKILGSDIRYIKTNTIDFNTNSESFFRSNYHYLLLLLPFIILLVSIPLFSKMKSSLENVALNRRKKANKKALERLKSAKNCLQNQDKKRFYEEIFKAIYGYLSDKLAINTAELNKENISNYLNLNNIEQSIQEKLFSIIETSEIARFSPSSSFSETEVYQQTLEIISQLENELK
jgi:hypothetical protein